MAAKDRVIRTYDARVGEIEYESDHDWVWVRFYDNYELLPVHISHLRPLALVVSG